MGEYYSLGEFFKLNRGNKALDLESVALYGEFFLVYVISVLFILCKDTAFAPAFQNVLCGLVGIVALGKPQGTVTRLEYSVI